MRSLLNEIEDLSLSAIHRNTGRNVTDLVGELSVGQWESLGVGSGHGARGKGVFLMLTLSRSAGLTGVDPWPRCVVSMKR